MAGKPFKKRVSRFRPAEAELVEKRRGQKAGKKRRHFTVGERHNNGMHPTRDTTALINLKRAGGRVMPGVGLLVTRKL